MSNFLGPFLPIRANVLFLCLLFSSIITKIYLISILSIKQHQSVKENSLPLLFLFLSLASAIISDLTWIIRPESFSIISYSVALFVSRLGYSLISTQYYSLALFIKAISERTFTLTSTERTILYMCSIFSLYFLYQAFFGPGITIEPTMLIINPLRSARSPFELYMMKLTAILLLPLLIIVSIYIFIKNSYSITHPKILKYQLNILIPFIIIPFIIFEAIIALYVAPNASASWKQIVVSLSSIYFAIGITYCMKKIMALRFLNFTTYVDSQKSFTFLKEFAVILEQLIHTHDQNELGHIAKHFCQNALNIPMRTISFHIRIIEQSAKSYFTKDGAIQNMLNGYSPVINSYLGQEKILVYDEIEFSNYYEESLLYQQLLAFLKNSNADIFLPIFRDEIPIAAIVIERNALGNRLYTKAHQDELLIFATYIGNILNLIETKDLQLTAKQKKTLENNLYQKHQEIKQYKESLNTLYRQNNTQIGVILYKNNHFIIANQAAQDFINFDLNTQQGLPQGKSIRAIAKRVEYSALTASTLDTDLDGKAIVITGMPQLEKSAVIILIYYPTITDIINKQLHLLKDPSEWDYLLYLETTEMGRLINASVPGGGKAFFNFKIDLLKGALTKKALFLNLPDDDLMPTVNLLNEASWHTQLHSITLQAPVYDQTIAERLFGVGTATSYKTPNKHQKALLERLNKTGSIFIQNIHHLDLKTQKMLAAYIKYGYFSPLYSKYKIQSDVRIICSSNVDLDHFVAKGSFSSELLELLTVNSIVMPSLSSLSTQELVSAIDGFSQQSLTSTIFSNLIALTDSEKNKIIRTKPKSLQQLKTKVINAGKLKAHTINTAELDTPYSISNRDLIEARKLGKYALRDRSIMAMLWDKFNRNQHQIAKFLGVNRSSVNRRCKEYELT